MSQPAPHLRRIALDAAGDRHDLVVPQNEALAGALAAVGVHLGAEDRVLGPDGSVVDTATAVRDLREGGLYAVAGAPAEGSARAVSAERSSGVSPLPWALTGFGVAAAAMAGAVPQLRWATVVVLALAAVAAVLSSALGRREQGAAVAAALGLGGAAAAVAVWPSVVDTPGLAIAVGAAGVSVLAAMLGFAARSSRVRAAATPVIVVSALFAGLAMISPSLGWSPAQLLIVAAAAAAVGLRAAPSLLVGVDPGYHIDYGRFMVLRWTVRGRVPEFIERVDEQRVRAIVEAAEARLASTVAVLSVLAAAGIPAAVVPLSSGDLVQVISGALFATWMVLALLLTSRRTAAPRLRTPPRAAVAVGLLGLIVGLAPSVSGGAGTLVAGVVLAAGAIAAVVILPLARGERSLGWSRTGDIVDSIAVALVLPCGILAAGTLNLLQGVLAA